MILCVVFKGKGTLYQEISQRINSAHVSIGDLLRREMEFKTPLGVHVEEVMRDGKLVDSAIIIRLLRDTLQKLPGKHVFVDGFPRSVQNAIDFYAVCGVPECAVWLDVSDEVLVTRLLNRGLSSGRIDDNRDVISKRLHVYRTAIEPLRAHFIRVGLPVYVIDASKSVEHMTQQFFEIPYFKRKMVEEKHKD
ncbi:adenylate kinase isoenzyme 1-like isoform X2 [Zophobas morio]|uniref:adenylate kinase isoenzyme 1-like isoform X2 n=1 Tax=Zophobas morio TaxID=2755281 RepID=UPI00308365C2